MRHTIVIVSVLVSVFAATSCGDSTSGSSHEALPGRVTRTQFGARWPFTVPRGVVSCDTSGGVVFTTPDGTAYWVNGTAGDEHKYRDIHPIWRKDPSTPGLRISIDPIIELGLKLCD